MHGSSSVPQDWLKVINEYGGKIKETYGVPVEEIQKGIKSGVRKVNIDTDLRLAATGAVRQYFAKHPDVFDPRKYLGESRVAMREICKARYQAFGAAGQAGKFTKIYSFDQIVQALRKGRRGMKLTRQPQFDYHQTQYLKSAVELSQLPADKGWEVAFIGRSNAGKSSAINAITGIRGLARTSSTPGQTQMINLFSVDKDLSHRGPAGLWLCQSPADYQRTLAKDDRRYPEARQCLRGLILVMDIRHPLKEGDQQLIAWAVKCEVPVHILLTKSDKLNTSEVPEKPTKR